MGRGFPLPRASTPCLFRAAIPVKHRRKAAAIGKTDREPASLLIPRRRWASSGLHAGLVGRFHDHARRTTGLLTGVVFGPQVHHYGETRALLPAKYQYATTLHHPWQCQFPVADWDTAFAIAEARECVNPRPRVSREHLPLVQTADRRLHHLFRRVQRRREQSRLVRAGLGSRLMWTG